MWKVLIFCLLFSVLFSANVEAKESIEDRVNKVEGNLQELSVKVDLLGSELQSISRSVSKILEHPEVKPLPDRTPNGLSRKKHLKLKPETDRLTDDLSRKKHMSRYALESPVPPADLIALSPGYRVPPDLATIPYAPWHTRFPLLEATTSDRMFEMTLSAL